MSAQFEETVVDPDLRHAQHLGEDLAQKVLAHRGRSPSRRRAGSGLRGRQGGGGGFRLLRRPAHEFQLTGAVPPHHVPGAVHPCTRFLKRAGHDLLGDRTRTVPFRTGEPGTRYIQLTGHPRRHRFEKGVQDVDTRVGRRIRDRYALPTGCRSRRVIPLCQDLLSLRGIQQVDSTDGPTGVIGHRPQDPDQPGDEHVHRGLVEQIGGIRDAAVQTGRQTQRVETLDDLEVQVELGALCPGRHDANLDPGQVERHVRDVVQRQGDLEQRVPGQGTGRGQLLHQPLERHLLVLQRVQSGPPHPPQHLGEGRVTGQVGAYHQRVHEEPGQILQGLIIAPGHRAADGDVLPRAQPGEQHRHRGLPHHEHRHALGTGQLRQLRMQFRRHPEAGQPTLVTGLHRSRPVHRQSQFLRCPGQRLPPVRQLAGQHAVRIVRLTQHLPLPQRVVRVLRRQRLPARRAPRTARRVRHRQIPPQQPHRPAVGRDVVHDQHQHGLTRHHQAVLRRRLLVPVEREQGGPHGQFGRRVEGMGGRLVDPLRQLVSGGDRDQWQGDTRLGDRHDLLVRLPLHLRKARPQTLVPRHHIGQRRPQRGDVQPPGQPQHQRNVVQRARAFETIQEPQPALSVRQRQHRRTWSGHHRGPRFIATGPLQPYGQAGHGRRLEQRPHRHLRTEDRADPADQPHREQ
ncbi:hypothetical protein GCM10009575_029390 [Streptomyces rhizosphaericus]|uniref:Uncharacterized protein n=1 Tax=Streptomyces rhizosphaericus TaxID=114699 RepID=A0ABN1PH73_9ACTN